MVSKRRADASSSPRSDGRCWLTAGVATEPLGLVHTGAGVDGAGHGEQQVREPVDVAQQRAGNRFDLGERDDTAFGAAADGAGMVELRRRRVPAWEDEALERR